MLNKILLFSLLIPALIFAQGRGRPPGRPTMEIYNAPSIELVQTAVANYVASMPIMVYQFGLNRIVRVKIVEAYKGKAFNEYYTYQYDIVTDFATWNDEVKGYYTSFFFYKKNRKWCMFHGDFSLWGEPKPYLIPQEDRDFYNETNKSRES